MIYRFTIISDEVDDFRREIQIDPENTFLDLQQAICSACEYDDKQLSSFFICSGNWEKETEITLEEMDSDSENDSWLMEDTRLSDLVEDEKQKLIFVFDYMTERALFIELSEIITRASIDEPTCTKSRGKAPQQVMDFEEFEKKTSSLETGEEFYGDQDYSIEEIDREGFEGLDSFSGSDAFDSSDVF